MIFPGLPNRTWYQLCPDAAGEASGAGLELCRADGRRHRQNTSCRPTGCPGKHDVSGTTAGDEFPRLESSGLRCGKDFFLAYSPEREDPGREDHSTQTIPKFVGGIDPVSGELAAAPYRKAIREVIPVSTAEVAEAAKLLENIYRSVNIALVNEMKVVLSAMGIDIWEVISAASTKPFGFQPFYPGRAWAGIAFQSIRTISRGKHVKSGCPPVYRIGRGGQSRDAEVRGTAHGSCTERSRQSRQGIENPTSRPGL